MSSETESENQTSDCRNNEDLNDESENSETYVLNENCVEVKLEVELNEFEAENSPCDRPLHFMNLVPQPPAEISSDPCANIGYGPWNPNLVSIISNGNLPYYPQNKQYNVMHNISQFNNAPCDTLNRLYPNQNSTECEPGNSTSKSTPYGFSVDNPVGEASGSSQQHSEAYIIPKKRRWKPTDAEKKRNYRTRIKEENPELWSAIKLKERCKKKEQREEKRLALFEMQKTQALIAECESSEIDNHKAHLQTLRERYPDVWIQFAHDMSPLKNSSKAENWKSQKRCWPSLTEAEKKRYYRRKMKEENPEMWTAVKMKDACKKREQREEKRHILLEMQKTKELISHADPADSEEHKSHLEELKEKYPELWMQLEDAIAATKMRTQMMLLSKTKKGRRTTKPLETYKDVVEAHKKFLYRQRLKEERPEYYTQMKARDAYAKSIRRMMIKRGICANSNGFDFSAITSSSSELGLSVGDKDDFIMNSESNRYYSSSKCEECSIDAGSDSYYNNAKKSEYYTNSKTDKYSVSAEKDVYDVNVENSSHTVSGLCSRN